ncbi:MAG: hypothetical protein MJY71_01480 [Bacteroidaceae bacterium]|nr:hypothetical protein [Bacteroidaceae bacterium]
MTTKEIIKEALSKYLNKEDKVTTDILIQPGQNGEVIIWDDDSQLSQGFVEDTTDIPEEDFYNQMEQKLRSVLDELNKEMPFDTLAIWQPFSFVLVDQDKESITELMLIDQDTQLASHALMEGLDEELDDFLKHLLE